MKLPSRGLALIAGGTAVPAVTLSASALAAQAQAKVPTVESGATGWTATSGVINTDGAHSHSRSG